MPEIIRVYESDSYDIIANKLYFKFELGQSCSICGFMMEEGDEPVPKGEVVIRELERMDKFYNMQSKARDGKWRRRRVKPVDTIGDYNAQKQWRFKKTITDNKIKYDIWRTQ